MPSNLYKRYPCPASGHLDITMTINRAGTPMEHKLVRSSQKSPLVRVHTFENVKGEYSFPIEVKVTPRSPNSRWYKQ